METLRVQNLPVDVLIEVIRNLQASDIQNLALTCRSFGDICQAKTVWLDALLRDVYSQNIPTPQYRQPLDSLPDDACQALAVHPVRLQKVMTSAEPKQPAYIVPLCARRSVTWVRLVLARWLLVASSDRTTSVINLWDVSSFYSDTAGATPLPVCESYLEGPVYSGLVDVQDGRVVVALEIHADVSKTTAILEVILANGSSAFSRPDVVSNRIAWLRAMRGPWIGFAVCDEQSIPGVFNWRYRTLILLANTPDPEGGTLAMDVKDGIVATINPAKVAIYSLDQDAKCRKGVKCLREIRLSDSVGFADIKILDPPLEDSTAEKELRFAIAGEDGIFLYGVSLGLSGTPTVIDEEAVQLWHQATPPEEQDEDSALPTHPTIDACGTISWLEACAPYARTPVPQITFHTLSRRPVRSSSPSVSHLPSVYTLSHPEVPALYAMGVYDFDAGLGFAVFGNYYGELAFFDLSGPGTKMDVLSKCFPPLPSQPASPKLERAPSQIPVRATFGLPLPYCDPHENFSREVRDKVLAGWRAFPSFPQNVPPNWEISTFDDERDTTWKPYVRRLPLHAEDKAWMLEHVYHFYGTPVPLMRDYGSNLEVFQVGGVLFYMSEQDLESCYAVDADMSPEELAVDLNTGTPPPRRNINQDEAALLWYENVSSMRLIELRDARDRWAEMKRRGGDVDEAWLDRI